MPGICRLVALPRPMGALEAVRGDGAMVHTANRSKLQARLNIWTFNGVRLAAGPVLLSL